MVRKKTKPKKKTDESLSILVALPRCIVAISELCASILRLGKKMIEFLDERWKGTLLAIAIIMIIILLMKNQVTLIDVFNVYAKRV